MEFDATTFQDDAEWTRARVAEIVAQMWLDTHRDVVVSAPNLVVSLHHLLTHYLASGPGNRRSALPAGAGVVLARAAVDQQVAGVLRSFAKHAAISAAFASPLARLCWVLCPAAAAIQTTKAPCAARAVELLREAGLLKEAGSLDRQIDGTMVKDRVVSVLTPFVIAEHDAAPGLSWDTYQRGVLAAHVGTVGRLVFDKLVAATTRALPTPVHCETANRFEQAWAEQRDRLIRLAARIHPGSAEDVVQEAGRRVFDRLRDDPAILDLPHLPAYLSTVVRNTARSELRRASTRRELAAGDSEVFDAPVGDSGSAADLHDLLTTACRRAAVDLRGQRGTDTAVRDARAAADVLERCLVLLIRHALDIEAYLLVLECLADICTDDARAHAPSASAGRRIARLALNAMRTALVREVRANVGHHDAQPTG